MNIFIKTLMGYTLFLKIDPFESIKNVKLMIQTSENIIPNRQRLIFLGNPLKDDTRTLSDYDIKDDSTLHLVTFI